MPLGENNLDELLKGLSNEDDEFDMEDGGDEDFNSGGFNSLTEDDIDRILSVKPQEPKSEDTYGDDVVDMLEGTGDGELQEIQDLLRKSDRNETIYEEAEPPEELENPADRLLADIEGADEIDLPEKVPDKKKQRALLKAQRKEEKAAKKAARKAEKGKRKKGKKGADSDELGEVGFIDKEKLDGIVSGAGLLGRKNDAPEDDIPVKKDTAKRSDTKAGMAVEEVELEQAAELVPDVESGFAAVDIDEIDALIPDITEKKGEGKEKKKGFISKALSFLLEEEEEEPENEDIQLSDENKQILAELDKESVKEKPKKGKKKDKKKDKKKVDKKAAKPKKEKASKPKKEKKPKEEEPYVPGKRLTFKKMLPILLLGATVGAVIFIFVAISTDYMDRQVARTAFTNGEYEKCYQNLFGKNRNEEEEIMYGKSESILRIRLWYREYEMFMDEGRTVEALDSLIQTVHDYQGLYEYAARWDAGPEISVIYADILNILSEDYAISEEDALEIGAVVSDIEYTRIVTALASGKAYGSWGRPAPILPEEGGAPKPLPDELPEESEMEQGGFVDNQ